MFTDYVIQDGDELPSSAAVPSLISDCVVYFIHILFTNAYFRGRIIIGLFLNSCVVFGTANAQTHLDTPLPLELALVTVVVVGARGVSALATAAPAAMYCVFIPS